VPTVRRFQQTKTTGRRHVVHVRRMSAGAWPRDTQNITARVHQGPYGKPGRAIAGCAVAAALL